MPLLNYKNNEDESLIALSPLDGKKDIKAVGLFRVRLRKHEKKKFIEKLASIRANSDRLSQFGFGRMATKKFGQGVK